MKILGLLVSVFLFNILAFNHISAHVSGIPFLKINGAYAPANPSYYATDALNDTIPQDLGVEKYLVGQPITFEIDRTQVPLNQDLIDKATFRWRFGQDTDYKYGLKVTHTYAEIGSHLIVIDIKSPLEKDFTPYNEIGVDIVQNRDYQTPTAVIVVDAKEYKSNQPLNFKVNFNTNPGVKITNYYWFVDGKKIENTPTIDYSFKDQDFFKIVFLKFTDSNGFNGYSGAWIEALSGKIKIEFPPNFHDQVIVKKSASNQENSTSSAINKDWPLFLLISLITILLITILGKIVKRKAKQNYHG